MQRVNGYIYSGVYNNVCNNTSGPQLRLITCGGAFDSGADHDDR